MPVLKLFSNSQPWIVQHSCVCRGAAQHDNHVAFEGSSGAGAPRSLAAVPGSGRCRPRCSPGPLWRQPRRPARRQRCAGRQRLAQEHQHSASGIRSAGVTRFSVLLVIAAPCTKRCSACRARSAVQGGVWPGSSLQYHPTVPTAPASRRTHTHKPAAAASPQVQGPPGSSPLLKATVKLFRNEGTGSLFTTGPTVRYAEGGVPAGTALARWGHPALGL